MELQTKIMSPKSERSTITEPLIELAYAADNAEYEKQELAKLNLPNLYECAQISEEIKEGKRPSMRPLYVRPPLPGKYSERAGERITRNELLPLVDQWVDKSANNQRFIIQGGNRYISKYLDAIGIETASIKVMSIHKAPLYNQLLTLLTPLERQSECDESVLAAISPILRENMLDQTKPISRADVLKILAAQTVTSPFQATTNDEYLQSELLETVQVINNGLYPVANRETIMKVLEGTEMHQAFAAPGKLHFLDDLFYRGRTLYSLAVIVDLFGGNTSAIQLTSLCCDKKSSELSSPYHTVLEPSKLYPFENSIRTEQGYWQDVGDRYIFTDMADYWELLHSQPQHQKSPNIYSKWQSMLRTWYEENVDKHVSEPDQLLITPLIWLQVYHDVFGLELNTEKIVDQKGYRIGACVPFAQLIDRFVSQEETVEVRSKFKAEIIQILIYIRDASQKKSDRFSQLTKFYRDNQCAIDYHGLNFMFENEEPPEMDVTPTPEYTFVVETLKQEVMSKAVLAAAPYIVGINGVDTSGKTRLAAALEVSLKESGVQVTTVHVDHFTNPRSLRHNENDVIGNYYNHNFDVDGLRRHILRPIVEGRLPKIALRHVDPKDESVLVEHFYDVRAAPSVVIIEGVFIFKPELYDYFGLKIFVDIPLMSMLERAVSRDVPRFGFGILAKYIKKYIPAQKYYLDTVKPRKLSDIIIDNSNWEKPTISKN